MGHAAVHSCQHVSQAGRTPNSPVSGRPLPSRRPRRPPPIQVPDHPSTPTCSPRADKEHEDNRIVLRDFLQRSLARGDLDCAREVGYQSAMGCILRKCVRGCICSQSISKYVPRDKSVWRASSVSIQPPFPTAPRSKYDHVGDSAPYAASVSRRGSGRWANEDRVTIIPPDEGAGGMGHNDRLLPAMYAVYDGHGGSGAAELAAKLLPLFLIGSKGHAPMPSDLPDCGDFVLSGDMLLDEGHIAAAFSAADAELCARLSTAAVLGTTATVAVLAAGPTDGTTLLIAHVGDSRACLISGSSVRFLTRDHVPTRPDEKLRIAHVGGAVLNGRVNGVLAVSRALGDRGLKAAVIPEPEICEVRLTPQDEFLVLATDGLWDFMSERDVAQFMRGKVKGSSLSVLAERLTEYAIGVGATDDISVVVVNLATHMARGCQQTNAI